MLYVDIYIFIYIYILYSVCIGIVIFHIYIYIISMFAVSTLFGCFFDGNRHTLRLNWAPETE